MTPRPFPPQDERVETGPIQFGDDWPGIFIRGDHAFGLQLALTALLNGSPTGIDLATVENLRDLLGECIWK